MRGVSRSFRGHEGVFLQFGDSLTMAAPNVIWARAPRPDHLPAERDFLQWAHAGERNERDGWYLATAASGLEDPQQRSFTAAVGCSARYLLSGAKGIPPLETMLATYGPRMAVYSIGTSDIIRKTPLPEYADYVEQALDLLLAHGTIPLLATVTPSRTQDDEVRRMNEVLRRLAERRRLPLVDVYAAMAELNPDVASFLGEDGIHPTWVPPATPLSTESFLRSGYLLRCWLILAKGMEVKRRALDPAGGT